MIALITSDLGNAIASGTTTTAGVDTSGADLAVIGIGQSNATNNPLSSVIFSDSNSNSWSSLTKKEGVSGIPFRSGSQLAYVLAPVVGAAHTFSADLGTQGGQAAAAAFSGVGSFGAESAGGASSGAGTTCQPGSLTPSEDNCLLITAVGYYKASGDPNSISIDSGFTILQSGLANSSFAVAIAYKIQTSAGAENPTWTHGTNLAGALVSATVMAYWKSLTSLIWGGNNMAAILAQ